MSFGAINNKYENRQYNYTAQKRVAEKRIHTQQQMMPVKRGEEEEIFQIGAQTFTIKEWKEFLDKFDSVQEVLEASMRERHAKQEKERLEKELEKKLEEALGVENILEVKLEGYYIGTHAETGIQYVMRPGDEGRE